MLGAAGAATGGLIIGSTLGGTGTALAGRTPTPRTPAQALAVLMRGNRRYVQGGLELRDYTAVGERIASEQRPFAAIITCSDSRISPALVFDVDHGNIFVSRVAGNALDAGMLGSTEYAVAVLGVRLIMILGHSNCGAVKSAIKVVEGKASYPPARYGAIGRVVRPIQPAVRAVPPAGRTVDSVIAENARLQARRVAARGPIIAAAVRSGRVGVVAGVYDIATGRVNVLDERSQVGLTG